MKLFGDTEKEIKVMKKFLIQKLLAICNVVNNDYQQDSRVLYRLVSNKSFGQLSKISLKNVISFKKFNSEFSYTEIWFTGQNSKPLDIGDKINLTLAVN